MHDVFEEGVLGTWIPPEKPYCEESWAKAASYSFELLVRKGSCDEELVAVLTENEDWFCDMVDEDRLFFARKDMARLVVGITVVCLMIPVIPSLCSLYTQRTMSSEMLQIQHYSVNIA